MRFALVCPTVGETRRGYERFVTELFRLLRPEIDVTLFKGAGSEHRDEVVIPHLRRDGAFARLCRNRLRYLRDRLEYASFAAPLWAHLARGDFDLVHIIDPPLGPPLARFRRLARHRYRLLFTCGCPVKYAESRFADHFHCLTPAERDKALANGVPADRVTMIPVGVDAGPLLVAENRESLRRAHGIAPGTFVVLAVTTFNRHHKRVDYLIDE